MASSISVPSNTLKSHPGGANYTPALAVLTSLFFTWGFITCLNDILIPHLKSVFTLSYSKVMFIQFSFFTAYAVASIPSGWLVEKVGYKQGIVIGLLTAGAGCLLFYPAAGLGSYPLFLGALFVLAAGITLLQVAANPYVAVLGAPGTASSRLILTQAFNSLGTTLAPLVGAGLILSLEVKSATALAALNAEELAVYRTGQAGAVQVPYLWLALVLIVTAAVFAVIKLPMIAAEQNHAQDGADNGSFESKSNAWSHPHLVLGALGIFMYVGGEVSIGSFLVNYLGQPQIAGLMEADAGRWVALYWGGAMVGRFIGSYLTRVFRPHRYLACNAIVAGALVVISMLTAGRIAMWSILAVGFFNSIMFPTIFTLAIAGLNKHTGQGSGILCTAIVGGALIPLLQGFIADHIGIQHAFFLPVLCYCYIAYYGWKGCLRKHW